MKTTLLLVCLLSLVLLNTAPAKGVKYAKAHASSPTITAVSADSISVVAAKVAHTYKITSQTAIHIDGVKAGAKDLKKGMHAAVTTGQLDPNTAMAVEATNVK